jgi:hypothetical protein
VQARRRLSRLYTGNRQDGRLRVGVENGQANPRYRRTGRSPGGVVPFQARWRLVLRTWPHAAKLPCNSRGSAGAAKPLKWCRVLTGTAGGPYEYPAQDVRGFQRQRQPNAAGTAFGPPLAL